MLTDKKYVSLKFSVAKFRERNKDLSLLLDISSMITASGDLKEMLTAAITKVTDHFHLDAARLYLMDEERRFLKLVAWKGIEPGRLETVSLSEGFSGKAARTRSFIAQYVTELEDPKRARLLEERGFKIVICVPLIAMDNVLGVMNLAGKQVIALNQEMVDLLTAIGNQIAIALNNARLFEDIKEKAREIEKKNETIKFFAYSFSHDLKGPAIAIHGFTKRLHSLYSASLDEKGRAYCDQILKASIQVQSLVEDLNAYIRAKEAPLDLEKTALSEVLKEIRDEYCERLSERQIEWVVPEKDVEVFADRLSLTRALRNLVDNALKYGGKDLKRIRIGCESDADFHVFSVEDDGVGVKAEDSEELFKLFHRHESSKGTEGTGLGLAIVKEIAERHRGKAWVAPSRKKGVTFSFSILRKDDQQSSLLRPSH